MDSQTVYAQEIGKGLNDAAVHLIEEDFELVFLVVVDFFDHNFGYFGAFVFINFDFPEDLIFPFLCEFIIVDEHLIKLFLSLFD